MDHARHCDFYHYFSSITYFFLLYESTNNIQIKSPLLFLLFLYACCGVFFSFFVLFVHIVDLLGPVRHCDYQSANERASYFVSLMFYIKIKKRLPLETKIK